MTIYLKAFLCVLVQFRLHTTVFSLPDLEGTVHHLMLFFFLLYNSAQQYFVLGYNIGGKATASLADMVSLLDYP